MTTNPFLDPSKEIVQGKSDADILREWQERIEKTFTRPLEDCLADIESGAAKQALDDIGEQLEGIKQSVGDYLTTAQGWASQLQGGRGGPPMQKIATQLADMMDDYQEYVEILSGCSAHLKERRQATTGYLTGLRSNLKTVIKRMQEAEKAGDAAAVRSVHEEFLRLDSRMVKVQEYRNSVGKLDDETDAMMLDITLTTNVAGPLIGYVGGSVSNAGAMSAAMSNYKAIRKAVSSATGKKGQNGQSGGTP